MGREKAEGDRDTKVGATVTFPQRGRVPKSTLHHLPPRDRNHRRDTMRQNQSQCQHNVLQTPNTRNTTDLHPR